jgi:hypothetical protein
MSSVVGASLLTKALPKRTGRVTRHSEKGRLCVQAATGWLHKLPITQLQVDGLSPSRTLASGPAWSPSVDLGINNLGFSRLADLIAYLGDHR